MTARTDDAVVITQGADVFHRGSRYPFRPDYRITWPGCDFEIDGRTVQGGAQRSTRAEARQYAAKKAKALGLPVVEVGFHMGGAPIGATA